MERSAIRDTFAAETKPGFRYAPSRLQEPLLPVLGQHLLAALAELRAILLQAGEHGAIAIVHHGTAEARNVARASIMAGLLLR
jgi:hypothetical protein